MHFCDLQKCISNNSLFIVLLKFKNIYKYYVPLKQKAGKRGKKMRIFKNLKKGNVKNKDSGITLIALVITVIVLLILARHFHINVKSVIIVFYKKQQMLKQKVMRLK